MGAMGLVLHANMLEDYKAGTLEVLDLDSIGVEAMNKLPRISKPVAHFTVIGKTTLERAHLEAERRHCGNKTEQTSSSNIEVGLRLLEDSSRQQARDDRKPIGPADAHLGQKQDQFAYVLLLKELYVAYATTDNKVSEREREEEIAEVSSAHTDAAAAASLCPCAWQTSGGRKKGVV
jgi:hypothetical protein